MGIEILIGLLGTLANAALNPAFNHTKGEAISSLLKLVASLLKKGDEAKADLIALKEQIEKMVAEGRDPTPDEWDALRARSDAAHDAIQNG